MGNWQGVNGNVTLMAQFLHTFCISVLDFYSFNCIFSSPLSFPAHFLLYFIPVAKCAFNSPGLEMFVAAENYFKNDN